MPFEFPRCQAIPGINRASFLIDGREVAGYDFGVGSSRPFFYPLLGPSGRMLTRIGHPNPVGHEHHKSVWFAHQFVDGVNFWGEPDGRDVQIRHRRVNWYEDGHDWAALASDIEWYAEGRVRMAQSLIAAVEPIEGGGFALDLQSRFTSPSGNPVELSKTNFGFLGVRLAKTLSEQFGGGQLTNADGDTGEDAIFGHRSRWVDDSGPAAPEVVEGICYFDHPDNPRHPTHWHVRRDGWMGAAFCLEEPYGLALDHPLDLRYRLLIHPGPADRSSLQSHWEHFAGLPPYDFKSIGDGPFPTIRRGAS